MVTQRLTWLPRRIRRTDDRFVEELNGLRIVNDSLRAGTGRRAYQRSVSIDRGSVNRVQKVRDRDLRRARDRCVDFLQRKHIDLPRNPTDDLRADRFENRAQSRARQIVPTCNVVAGDPQIGG